MNNNGVNQQNSSTASIPNNQLNNSVPVQNTNTTVSSVNTNFVTQQNSYSQPLQNSNMVQNNGAVNGNMIQTSNMSNSNSNVQSIPINNGLQSVNTQSNVNTGSTQVSNSSITPPTNINNINNNTDNTNIPIKTKKSFKITPILVFIIIGLGIYIFYITNDYNNKVNLLKYSCTPVNSYNEEKEIDINSTLIKDLYKKVYTSIREDLAQPEWNDTMKLYLAYRQINENDKYSSNCDGFSPLAMEPYTCVQSTSFVPKAFKKETLELEWKKMFGEDSPLYHNNIKLNNSCIGGYQYIEQRGEYVEGYCENQTATSYKAEKKLVKAITYNDTIILTENVKYKGNERMNLPDYLKSGDYNYIFRLDMNYNYVLIEKSFVNKYD